MFQEHTMKLILQHGLQGALEHARLEVLGAGYAWQRDHWRSVEAELNMEDNARRRAVHRITCGMLDLDDDGAAAFREVFSEPDVWGWRVDRMLRKLGDDAVEELADRAETDEGKKHLVRWLNNADARDDH